MKIYTRTGDKGTTSLLGGTRVAKHHLRIEAYGTVDELNSWLGLLRDQPLSEQVGGELLKEIQDRLFTIGSNLAMEMEESKKQLPDLHQEDIVRLEAAMDTMNEDIPPLRSFVLPGGQVSASQAHVARTVCRRAERAVIALDDEEFVPALVIQYLNRLSDYLFTLARAWTHAAGAEETPWKPRV
ncbi:MAG TPA: cob(I)yrinic acid a,c-diamide adenosyltransferase [Cytophagales bacterium]|nr:cob(I)yrinic acid a,c-diamide adenosyltransferase [Cytophagales bacterium]HAA21956.1 cob(I)yrinic acid a,c-diamide adenosyltransferase [Cytophagales bacterium]HAP61345.1 cob(I)yrinic acid a,c-diamide adenosyltransferase [Cytophagales bacterium]